MLEGFNEQLNAFVTGDFFARPKLLHQGEEAIYEQETYLVGMLENDVSRALFGARREDFSLDTYVRGKLSKWAPALGWTDERVFRVGNNITSSIQREPYDKKLASLGLDENDWNLNIGHRLTDEQLPHYGIMYSNRLTGMETENELGIEKGDQAREIILLLPNKPTNVVNAQQILFPWQESTDIIDERTDENGRKVYIGHFQGSPKILAFKHIDTAFHGGWLRPVYARTRNIPPYNGRGTYATNLVYNQT